MDFGDNDKMPDNISIIDAYRSIRKWYKANRDFISNIVHKGGIANDEYRASLLELIDILPSVRTATELEMTAVLKEVIRGTLELCYHASDGKYKMSAYAHAALHNAKKETASWTQEELALLAKSKLRPHLKVMALD